MYKIGNKGQRLHVGKYLNSLINMHLSCFPYLLFVVHCCYQTQYAVTGQKYIGHPLARRPGEYPLPPLQWLHGEGDALKLNAFRRRLPNYKSWWDANGGKWNFSTMHFTWGFSISVLMSRLRSKSGQRSKWSIFARSTDKAGVTTAAHPDIV